MKSIVLVSAFLAVLVWMKPSGLVYAHGVGERYDLPIPLDYYFWGSAAAIQLSFAVIGAFVKAMPEQVPYWRWNLLGAKWAAWLFSSNSFKNQLLLVTIKKNQLDSLFKQIPDTGIYSLTIDVLNQTISTPENISINFLIDKSNKDRVIYEHDDIELTLKNREKIKAFEEKTKKLKPWLFDNEKGKK